MRWQKKWFRHIAFLAVTLAVCWYWLFSEPRYGGRSVTSWIADFNPHDQANYLPAQRAVAEIGPAALPYLTDHIKDYAYGGRPRSRQLLLDVSGHLPELLREPIQAQYGHELVSAQMAIGSLWQMGQDAEAAKPLLLSALKARDANIRSVAAGALISIAPEDEAVIKTVFAAVEADKEQWILSNFSSAFYNGKPAMVPYMKQAFPRGGPDVRFNILRALARIEPKNDQTREFLYEAFRDYPQDRGAAAVALVEYGEYSETLVDALVQVVAGNDTMQKHAAVQCLLKLGDRAAKAKPAMRNLISSNDPWLQAPAINFLMLCGEERSALPPVLGGNLPPSLMPEKAVPFLHSFGRVQKIHPKDRSEVTTVAGMLNDTNDTVRGAALFALSRFESNALPYIGQIEGMLDDAVLWNRLGALEMLMKLQPDNKKLHATLEDWLDDGGYFTKLECIRLVQTRPEFVERYRRQLQSLSKENKGRLQKAAEMALAQSGGGGKKP